MKYRFTVLYLVFLFFTPFFLLSEGFAYDTLVKTVDGYKPIQDLCVDEFVIGYDELEEKCVALQVTDMCKECVHVHYEIHLHDTVIILAGSQKFYIPHLARWVSIEKIISGKHVKAFEEALHIKKIVLVVEPVLVCQISVHDHHNFFITKNDLLVHNSEFASVAVGGAATLVFETGAAFAGAGIGATVGTVLVPLATVGFLGYKFGKLLFAEYKDKKLKQKNKNKGNAQSSCCGSCAQGNSCTQTVRKIGCTPEELHERKRDAEKIARDLGFERTFSFTFDAHGEKVFTNKKRFITIDNTCHKGGFWKVFDKAENRIGTFSKDLKVMLGD